MYKRNFIERFSHAPKIFAKAMRKKLDLSQSTILDFGCDYGVMTLGLAHRCKPKHIVGIDINTNYRSLLDIARKHKKINALPVNLEFQSVEPDEKFSKRFKVDCVFSWSVMEHVNRPFLPSVAKEIYDCLVPGGYAYIQIAPLFYSAYGSHLQTIIPEPWGHLNAQLDLFKNRVYNVVKSPPYDQEDDANFSRIKDALWSTYKTLNKITANELASLFQNVGFKLVEETRSKNKASPPRHLLTIYNKDVLTTEQVMLILTKR